MDVTFVIVGVALGAVLGGAIGFLVGRGKAAGTEADVHAEVARLQGQLDAQEAAFGSRLSEAVLEATERVSEGLAQRNAEDAKARLAAQKMTLENVVEPMTTKLGELEAKVKDAENSRIAIDTAVLGKLQDVTNATADLTKRAGDLTTALTGGQTRGKWGEFQLQRIIEVAGLTERITWITQQQEGGGKGAQRPDLVVHIPEGRVLVVDAKAPTVALDGDEPTGETDAAYARRLRTHIIALGKKDYIEGIPNAVGYVFLFLPSEASYAGALRADPDVLAFAAENRVAVVAPSTLLSALTVVESIWRQFAANEHLEDALNDVRKLHGRLQVFVNHFEEVGTRLRQATEAYNDAVGSFDHRVIPLARKIEAANLASGHVTLEVVAIEDEVRAPRTPALPAGDAENDVIPGAEVTDD